MPSFSLVETSLKLVALDLALAFSTRASSTVVSSSLHRWRQVYHTHQNAQSFAVHYHSAQLRFKMLLVWRIQLRARLRMVKEARLAQKYFLQRRFWKQWKTQFAQKKLDKKLVDFEARLARRHFLGNAIFAVSPCTRLKILLRVAQPCTTSATTENRRGDRPAAYRHGQCKYCCEHAEIDAPCSGS